MNIPQSLKKVLNEEDIKKIKDEFDKQVKIAVEAEMVQYDEKAVKATEKLIDTINESHKQDLVKLINKLKNKFTTIKESYEKKYNKIIQEDAEAFKINLARNIEKLIDKKVNNIVNYKTIQEAAKNNTANIVLSGLRHQLAVDSALMQESISKPMKDVKAKMSKASSYIKKLQNENAKLTAEATEAKSKLLIESKISNLPDDTANYMRRMLEGQDAKFINEQFDYILGLYKDSKDTKRSLLKEEALKKSRKSRPSIFKTKDLIPEQQVSAYDEDSGLIDEIVNEMNSDFSKTFR